MTEITSGLRKILSVPIVYQTAQRLVSTQHGRQTFLRDYLRPKPTDALLDAGCGTGSILATVKVDRYVGFDPSEAYIEEATAAWGDRGQFFAGTADVLDKSHDESYDVAVAKGVLHHLSDAQAHEMLRQVAKCLKPGGRFVTIDPCWQTGQSRIARFLISRDRGQDVRSPDGYTELLEEHFGSVTTSYRDDLLRVPYSHSISECTP